LHAASTTPGKVISVVWSFLVVMKDVKLDRELAARLALARAELRTTVHAARASLEAARTDPDFDPAETSPGV